MHWNGHQYLRLISIKSYIKLISGAPASASPAPPAPLFDLTWFLVHGNETLGCLLQFYGGLGGDHCLLRFSERPDFLKEIY